jgi:hypothetical protein
MSAATKMAKAKAKGYKTPTGTSALHVEAGEHHVAGILDLHVLIVPDENFWFAQGLEIDYGAQGDSAEDAKEKFQQGLAKTINLNLQMHGNIESLLQFAPSEILQEAARKQSSIQNFGQVSFHEVNTSKQDLLFSNIKYLLAQEAAA